MGWPEDVPRDEPEPAPEPEESRTVGEIVNDVRLMCERMGKKNPNKALLLEVGQALIWMAQENVQLRKWVADHQPKSSIILPN